jgi:hypothetical protein
MKVSLTFCSFYVLLRQFFEIVICSNSKVAWGQTPGGVGAAETRALLSCFRFMPALQQDYNRS